MAVEIRRHVFGSREWFEQFVQTLNQDPEYQAASASWEDSVTVFVTDLPPPVREFVESDVVGVWFDLYHGRCRNFQLVKHPREKQASLTIYGSYEVVKKIALGLLSPTVAVLTGHVKVEGSLAKFLFNPAALSVASAFVEAVKKVPTMFLA
ncbi:MAG: SCP2 sterol-binding domain-containing protein [Candidatus Caldarchaeum sp.]|nr:SCP2 sterol-binding domain-containing protein [Candidatus Caldarchaeum sp.]MDW8434788.1 SCP2 sterol-binding domain-containing protein [Candidatus Caldarchaeum sp.]